MTARIGVAAFMQESNSFAPTLAQIGDFEIQLGGDLIDFFQDTNSEIAGFLDACKEHEWVAIPLVAATAISGGALEASCFEQICAQVLATIKLHPLDAVLLALHGAMSVEHMNSGDLELVRRVRRLVGPHIPIVVTHDLHANLGTKLFDHVDGLSGYRTYPHVDQRETGRRAGSILARVMNGQKSHHWRLAIPLLVPPQTGSTSQHPLKAVMERLACEFPEAEGSYASLFCVQPWLDFSPVSSSLAVTQFGPDQNTSQRLRDIAAHLWSIRRELHVEWSTAETVIEDIKRKTGRPVLVSEASDSPNSGGSGDHTGLLRCLLPHAGAMKSCLYLVDPDGAEHAHIVGIGGEFHASIGASIDARYSKPINIRARVHHVSDGTFITKGPAFQGRRISMGSAAVLAIEGLRIIVASRPVMMIDPELYRSQGVEPAAQDVVGIKSPLLFRAAYQSISQTIVNLDLPGPCRGRLDKVDFRRISRPIFPVDDFEWSPQEPERFGPP